DSARRILLRVALGVLCEPARRAAGVGVRGPAAAAHPGGLAAAPARCGRRGAARTGNRRDHAAVDRSRGTVGDDALVPVDRRGVAAGGVRRLGAAVSTAWAGTGC